MPAPSSLSGTSTGGAGEEQAEEGCQAFQTQGQHGISAEQHCQTFCCHFAAVCGVWCHLRAAEGGPVLPGAEETHQSSGGIPWSPKTLALWPQSPGKEAAGLNQGGFVPAAGEDISQDVRGHRVGCACPLLIFLPTGEDLFAQEVPRLLQGRQKGCLDVRWA